MFISNKGTRYSIKALTHITRHSEKVSLIDMAEEINAPKPLIVEDRFYEDTELILNSPGPVVSTT